MLAILCFVLFTLLVLSWVYFFLVWSFPENTKKLTRKDLINQNFDFVKKTEEKGEWVTFSKPKLTVYNKYKDADKTFSGKNESYFFGKDD